jgi:hypothetical protein
MSHYLPHEHVEYHPANRPIDDPYRNFERLRGGIWTRQEPTPVKDKPRIVHRSAHKAAFKEPEAPPPAPDAPVTSIPALAPDVAKLESKLREKGQIL